MVWTRCEDRYSPFQGLRVLLLFFFRVFTFIVGSYFLVSLALRARIQSVALRFTELHFVHPLSDLPMHEGFALVHGSEPLQTRFPYFLHGSRVAKTDSRLSGGAKFAHALQSGAT